MSLNSTLSPNTTLVHPQFFFINGFYNIPNNKYYFVLLLFVFVVSVLGNSFVMFIIYTESSFHTPKYMASFNLAVGDLGSSTAVIPNSFATFFFDSQYISFDACLANMFFVYCFNFIRSVTLTVLAFDRCMAIFMPLRYHSIITMQAMAGILTVAWAFIALFTGSYVALVTRLSFCKSNVVESFFCDYGLVIGMACNDISTNMTMVRTEIFLSLIIPLFFILLSYVLILRSLFKIASWKERFKAAETCSAHLMMVASYYLPALGSMIAAPALSFNPKTWMINILFSFSIPSMLNPIFYVLVTREVRQSSKKFFKGKFSSITKN